MMRIHVTRIACFISARFFVATYVCAAVLAACSGGGAYSANPSTGAGAAQSLHRVTGQRSATGPNLYVANADGGTVTVYAPGSTSSLRTISQGVGQPDSMAFDAAGNLYVSNGANSDVTVYSAGTSTLLRTITNKVSDPDALAFDASGNLYVGNYLHDPPITVYAPGSGKVLRSISRFARYPGALAFDASGNLHVVDFGQNSRIAVYPPGGRRPILSIPLSRWNDNPESIAIAESGDFFVVDCGDRCADPGSGSVLEYAPGSKTPLQVITQNIKCPIAVALDASGNLYAANYPAYGEAGSVTVYKAKNGEFVRKITKGVFGPVALAFDGSGNLYVANSGANTVTAYAPGASTPFETISEGIASPSALAFGP